MIFGSVETFGSKETYGAAGIFVSVKGVQRLLIVSPCKDWQLQPVIILLMPISNMKSQRDMKENPVNIRVYRQVANVYSTRNRVEMPFKLFITLNIIMIDRLSTDLKS